MNVLIGIGIGVFGFISLGCISLVLWAAVEAYKDGKKGDFIETTEEATKKN